MLLPDSAARHVQVLRMQPGAALQLFDGSGGEWLATVIEMGRKHVTVQLEALAVSPGRELPVQVTLALGMPANDRMDALVEKATELGVYAIQPLVCERSVLRLHGERAAKKVAHWQAVAVAACEQSGRAFVPHVHDVKSLLGWLGDTATTGHAARRGVLSLREAVSMRVWLEQTGAWQRSRSGAGPVEQHGQHQHSKQAQTEDGPSLIFLSGPEGGLSLSEEKIALDQGWAAVTLGHRVLRADTAPLAALSVIACAYEG
jgi:16S rRNA (uracil1498-N3)-methyltransferase